MVNVMKSNNLGEFEEKNNYQTLLLDRTIVSINYISRTVTVGKEYDMVMKYVKFLITKYEKLKRKRAAIFLEPQLDTGYPDIVVVEFNSMPKREWNSYRKKLTVSDFKILFFVQVNKSITLDDICNKLGFSVEEIQKTVSKLEKCKLLHVSTKGKCVKSVPLKSYCRISKIISIEAKIDKWKEAIRQAENNIWFSTESYILLNKDSCSIDIRHTCQNMGIGIILVNGKIDTVLRSDCRKFPVSYASLLFNDWILRYLNREEK